MNRDFVNIKVDREERPDLDAIYQQALALMGEQGGWPLTMFLTPEGEPFWGGTYFPPEPRYGRPGFAQVLEQMAGLWRQDRERIDQQPRDQLVAGPAAARHARGRRAAPTRPSPSAWPARSPSTSTRSTAGSAARRSSRRRPCSS